MKKIIAVLITLVYVSLTNYCLTYAVGTGESHSYPGLASASDHHSDHDHEQAHSHDQGHEHGDVHDRSGEDSSSHHESDKSDTCCATFSSDVPGLLPAVQTTPKLAVVADFVFINLSDVVVSFAQKEILCRDTGPPGPHIEAIVLSLLTPRAPPSSESL